MAKTSKRLGTRFGQSLGRKFVLVSPLLLLVAHQFSSFGDLTYYVSPAKQSNEIVLHSNIIVNSSSSSSSSWDATSIQRDDEFSPSSRNSSVEVDNDSEIPEASSPAEPLPDYDEANDDDDDPFDWESHSPVCHVLENICRTPNPNREWFYFTLDSEDNDGDTSIRKPKQPMITVMEPSSNVHINVSSSIPKRPFSQLSGEQQCTVSPIPTHVVTTGLYSQMLGEYYQKIVLPFSQIMRDYEMHANNKTNSRHQREKNMVQVYHHFAFEEWRGDILPSQELYMDGMPYVVGGLQSWALTDPPNCTCYHRLVFCGYIPPDEERNAEKNITKLLPNAQIDYPRANCSAGWGTSAERFTNEGCPVWQELRTSLIHNYERTNPQLKDDITAYRANLIYTALQDGLSSDDVASEFLRDDISKLSEWRIIGLAQRSDNRHWLNMNETLSRCITQFYEKKIVCVEVDVAHLPTNFTSASTNEALTEVQEQFVLYRSINALVGIHGSHLTQGVLMPAGSIMMELFQWFPRDWGGFQIWGDGWTNCQGNPTPMGILWHNTDINEVSYTLERDSVPLCLNMSNSIAAKNVTLSDSYIAAKNGNDTVSELEHCLTIQNDPLFRWDRRNFNVRWDIMEKFVETFFYYRFNTSVTEMPPCDDFRQRGEENGFRLYNIMCMGDDGTIRPHHYYLKSE